MAVDATLWGLLACMGLFIAWGCHMTGRTKLQVHDSRFGDPKSWS